VYLVIRKMTRSVIIHAVVEMLVLSSITVFLNRRIKAGEDVIRGLKKQVDNLQSTVNTMQKNMDHLYAVLEQMAGPPMPMMMSPGMGLRQRRVQQPYPIPPQPQSQPQQETTTVQQQPQQEMAPDFGMGGMMQGLLSAMGGMMQPQAAVVKITTSVPQPQSKPKVEIQEDDDDPKVQEALDQLLKETIGETQGLKEDEQKEVNAQ